jgi:hypothetical protein
VGKHYYTSYTMKLHSRLCVSLTAGMTVTQMDKVTQSNAASAEESAAPAEELTAQAEALKEDLVRLVDGQKAKQGRTATPSAARLAHHAAGETHGPGESRAARQCRPSARAGNQARPTTGRCQ